MDSLVCKICNAEFSLLKEVHFHVARSHKITIEEYYITHYPKYDLYTRELIKFKNINFYNSTLFNNRTNLVQYFKKHPNDETNLVKAIELRAKLKGLEFAPDTVSTRTSILPTPFLISHIGKDYNDICFKAGLKAKYDYKQELVFDNIKLDILIDTREQDQLILMDCNTNITKLEVGDYLCKNPYKKIAIERKSESDAINSLSGGYERLCAEFERAKSNEMYMVVLVETDLLNIINFDILKNEHSKVKASGDYLMSQIRRIINRYPFVQFLFVKSRDEAARVLKNIFLLKNDVKTIDLQFSYDVGKL